MTITEKAQIAVSAIERVAREWGFSDDEISGNVTIISHADVAGKIAIDIENLVDDIYNYYGGQFREAVDAIIAPYGFFLEPHYSNILTIANGR